ncbi:MAG: hypothetical protein CFE26_17645 [Verrucomicrobiales bacterium VVV1]|nr:MAG: hypothetical protein CFE26_17645 [Verrucomicrobiales bacterium VVV1]
MIGNKSIRFLCLLAALAAAPSIATAAPNKTEPTVQLNETGKQLEAKYAATLATLKEEIAKAPPVEVSLSKSQNALNFELPAGIRGVTVKELTLKPSK